jgi:pyruvate-ferredoxin/flavodoxin oxidoreductase
VDFETVRGTQFLQPLFEFSGACAGCGETPYLKLLSQLFGDRLMVANATGCSSIYGGNLPTTPWAVNAAGRGPAWSNSLFEDNAEFGLGFRLAADQHRTLAQERLAELREQIGAELVDEILEASQRRESEYTAQRERVGELRRRLDALEDQADPAVVDLRSVIDQLVRRSVWIVGGDGWAYDIGAGGLDHVLASGRDVNVLVLDTEVYSNTGGQASKSTPLGAVAKFAAAGKLSRKKDLGMIAMSYGNVFVGSISMGANPLHTLRTIRAAESYRGPSLLIAFSHCIGWGIEMEQGMNHQKEAVACGYWPLYHYDPRDTGQPFHLDSRKPVGTFKDFAQKEARFAMLSRSKPQEADRLQALGQQDINARWALYEQFAAASPSRTGVSPVDTAGQASLPVGGEPKGPDGNGAKSSTTTKEVDQ